MGSRAAINRLLGKFGYEVRRSDASRRQYLLESHGVDLVLDIGAASGMYGASLRHFGFGGKIISFEPMRCQFEKLVQAANGDQNWSALNLALADEPGQREIHVAGNADSSSFLPMLDRHVREAPHTAYRSTEVVEVETLDRACFSDVRQAKNPFAKIDTQGSEQLVLDGACQSIGLLQGLQIEMSFTPLYEGALAFEALIDRISGEGFRVEAIEPGFRSEQTQQLLQADFIFFR